MKCRSSLGLVVVWGLTMVLAVPVVALATVLAVILIFALSLRLREREIKTIFKLGCRRMTIARLLGAEIMIIGLASSVAAVSPS